MRQEELLAYIDSQEDAKSRVSLSLIFLISFMDVMQMSDIYIFIYCCLSEEVLLVSLCWLIKELWDRGRFFESRCS